MNSASGIGECDEDENSDLITIHFLSQQEPETVVRVKQRSDRPRRERSKEKSRHRTRKEELFANAMGASPRSSMSSLSQSFSRLPESESNSWLNLRKLNNLLGSSESVATAEQQQQQHQPDFLSTLFDKLSGSLTAVSETAEVTQQRDQELLTYTLYNVTARRFKDSPTSPPPAPVGWRGNGRPSFLGADSVAFEMDEDAAAEAAAEATPVEEKAETPEIVRFLWAHQAKCWPGPVSNGVDGRFGHPIFSCPPLPKARGAPAQVADGDTDDHPDAAEDEDSDLSAAANFRLGVGGGRGDAVDLAASPRLISSCQSLTASPAAPLPPSPSLESSGVAAAAAAASPHLLSPSSASDDATACGHQLGCVKLALDFNFKSAIFFVHVIECRDLPVGDARRNRTDSYVKTCLLPDQTHRAKKRTKVRKNSQSPIFDEKLKYCITLSDLETRKLHVSAWHSADLLQSDVLLGELEIPISLSRLQCRDAVWYSFQQLVPSLELQLAHSKYVGEVTLSLKYVTPDNVNITDINQVTSNHGELRIWVKEARNLPSTRMGLQAADPYVKLCLLPDRTAKGKRRTPPVQKSCSPVWNLVLKFENLSVDELRTRALELTIWDNYRLMPGKKVFLGGILLEADPDYATAASASAGATRSPSPRSPARLSDEAKMWKTVMERHNVWVDGNLLLKGSMPKSKFLSLSD